MSAPTLLLPCPREGCGNSAEASKEIVCAVDFYALASMCRGKKRLGEPEAVMIQGMGRGAAYCCALCKQWHNGNAVARRAEFKAMVRDVVRALQADDRVGWRGILNLADSWHPRVAARARWREDLDQTQAFA